MGTIVFTKKYTGSIKRKISEGHIVPSVLPELYIETEKETKSTITNTRKYSSKIFNIGEKNSHVEITTNTLKLKVTTTVIDGVPYFKKLVGDVSKIKETPKECVDYGGQYFTNTDKDYIQIGNQVFLVQSLYRLSTYTQSPNVLVRRLKDRFKITIKNTNIEQVLVELENEDLLEPKVTRTYTLLPEVVLLHDDQYRYLIAHTFEDYIKQELHSKSEDIVLRDVPIDVITVEDYLDNYYLVKYKTFRSNLFVEHNKELSTHVELEPFTDKLLNIKMTSKPTVNTFLSITSKPTSLKKFETNPYMYTPLLDLNPKGYYFLWETESKYATASNTPLGCERVLLDKEKLLNKVTDSIETAGDTYRDFVTLHSTTVKTYTSAPSQLKTDLTEFLNIFRG